MKTDKVLSRFAAAVALAFAFVPACSADEDAPTGGTGGTTGVGGFATGGSTQGKGEAGKSNQGNGGSATASNECPTLSAPPETGKSCPQNGLVCTGPSGWPCTCSGQQRNFTWTCVERGTGNGGSSATAGGSGTSGKASGGSSGSDAGGSGNESGADSGGESGAEGGAGGAFTGGTDGPAGAGGEIAGP